MIRILLLAVFLLFGFSAVAETKSDSASSKPRIRTWGIRMCESVTFRSSSYDEDNLFTFRNGTFSAKTPWPAIVFGRGLRTPEPGLLRKGAIWELRMPSYTAITRDPYSGGSKDESFGIAFYGSVRFMLPLGSRSWQLYAGTGLNGSTSYESEEYSFQSYYYTRSRITSTRDYYAELVPQFGVLYQSHPRILIDVTMARLFGTSILSYTWSMNEQVYDLTYTDPDANNAPEHTESRRKSTSFNRFYADKLHLIDDLQFGISYLF